MSFLDFFKRNRKAPQLPEGTRVEEIKVAKQNVTSIPSSFDQYTVAIPTVSQDSKDNTDFVFSEDSHTLVFSETNPETGKIALKLRRTAISGNVVDLGTINDTRDKDDLKYIIKLLDSILDTPRIEGGVNPHLLEHLKKSATTKLQDLSKQKNIELSPDAQKVLDSIDVKTQLILHPDSILDYKKFEAQLQKTVDITELPFDQLMQYGEAISSRLKVLKLITTPEDALLHQQSLISFMRSKESSALQGKILAMLPLQDTETTPEDKAKTETIVQCLKTVAEEEVPNEDNILYATFLKLKEKRIISRLQEDLKTFKDSLGGELATQAEGLTQEQTPGETLETKQKLELGRKIKDYQRAETLVDILEEEKINPDNSTQPETEGPLQTEITSYMVSMLTEVSVSNYLKNRLKHDLALKGFLAAHRDEIPNADVASSYLAAKLHSSGQVIAMPKQDSLRSFIETTDYMTEDIAPESEFLLSVAKLEEGYIEKFYSPILKVYNKQQEKQTSVRSGSGR